MSDPIVKVRDLMVSYGGISALQGVSLSVKSGDIVALIGANGAGKTTLLNAMTGIVPAKSGSVLHKGEDITRLKSHEIMMRGIAHVPEGRKIFATLTTEENLKVGAFKLYKDSAKIQSLLEMCYSLFPILAERRKQQGGTLSGGEQQMLAIARGLMSAPDVLFLDEPSLGIAPIVVDKIFEFIVEINRMGKTIFLVEQNANIALEVASYAYVLETGRVVKENDTKSLLADDAVRKIYLGL
jgi:branched-chain amino acid transport system ATP-binding protein